MRISDWSSDVCSSDLSRPAPGRLNLPLLECGALVLAWTEAEEAQLPALMDQARANGIDDVAPLSRAEILALEPALSPQLRAGFRVPREFVIDPWSAPTAYLLQALANGAEVRRGCELRTEEHTSE